MSDALLFTRSQLSQLLGVTVPSISNAIDDGAPGVQSAGSRGKGAKIDGTVFIPWYLERERARTRSEAGSKKLSEIDRELDIELKREKLLKERAQMIPRSAFVAVMRDVFTRLKVAIQQMPDREAETILNLKDRQDAASMLRLIGDALEGELRSPDMWLPPEAPQLELSA